jgi:hypothetical protein
MHGWATAQTWFDAHSVAGVGEAEPSRAGIRGQSVKWSLFLTAAARRRRSCQDQTVKLPWGA